MLRITVQNTSGAPTVHLDGKLAGEWVKELEHVWDGLSIGGQATHTTLDLSGVSLVDADGKRLLGAMLRQGAKLEEPQPLVQFILDEMDHGCHL
jgi:anti-anti-sigma regulatory factor